MNSVSEAPQYQNTATGLQLTLLLPRPNPAPP